MKALIVVVLLAIVVTLGSAGVAMLRRRGDDKSRDTRMARALALRVALSIALFVFILLAWRLGWIQPGGLPVVR
ncbi:MAG TPA: twin transmembrane helix small protein [Burkholderiaceae bacterium]|nr:twin transmembrane helix small protein [Burkholderiaceae bacterium]